MKKSKTKTTETVAVKTPKKNTVKFVNKTYRLKKETPPLSLILASRHTQRFPLMKKQDKTDLLDMLEIKSLLF